MGPDRIVATTFSRAAAAEIATRVEGALREIAAWDGAGRARFGAVIRARLLDAGGARSSRTSSRRRAGDALARWPPARIDTLHGVAAADRARHALALGLAPGTRVLDEEEAQALSRPGGRRGPRRRARRRRRRGRGGAGAHRLGGQRCGPTRQSVQRLLDRLDEEGLAPRDLDAAPITSPTAAPPRTELLRAGRACAARGSPTLPRAGRRARRGARRRVHPRAAPRARRRRPRDLFTRRMPARGKRLPPDDELDDFIGASPARPRRSGATGLAALLRHAPGLRAPRGAARARCSEDARARLAARKRRTGALGFGDLLRTARDALRDRPDIARRRARTSRCSWSTSSRTPAGCSAISVYLLREREDAAERAPPGAAPEARRARRARPLPGRRPQAVHLRLPRRRRGRVLAHRRRARGPGRRRGAGAARDAWRQAAEPSPTSWRCARAGAPGAAILVFVNAFSSATSPGIAPPAPRRATSRSPTAPPSTWCPRAARRRPARVVFIPDDGASPEGADPIVRESSGAAREAHLAAAFVADRAAAPSGAPPPAAWARTRTSPSSRAGGAPSPWSSWRSARLDIPYVVAGRALYDAPEVRDVAALLRLLLDPRDRLAMATVLRGPMVAPPGHGAGPLRSPGAGSRCRCWGAGRPRGPRGPGSGPMDPQAPRPSCRPRAAAAGRARPSRRLPRALRRAPGRGAAPAARARPSARR